MEDYEVLTSLSTVSKKAFPPFTHKNLRRTKVGRWYDLLEIHKNRFSEIVTKFLLQRYM